MKIYVYAKTSVNSDRGFIHNHQKLKAIQVSFRRGDRQDWTLATAQMNSHALNKRSQTQNAPNSRSLEKTKLSGQRQAGAIWAGSEQERLPGTQDCFKW